MVTQLSHQQITGGYVVFKFYYHRWYRYPWAGNLDVVVMNLRNRNINFLKELFNTEQCFVDDLNPNFEGASVLN